ncbi:HIT family protein [Nonomuraea sp. 10N515B]|uniref:HIT family protein n=1 Tax=Nonomuraea sp. 10N515B TaxID=3457422 RepID=UPI003FCCFB45
MSNDLFCEIIAGERSAHVVSSDEVAVSFLDARPVFKGHVLVVPRVHVETLADLAEVGPFFERVQAMARAVEAALEAGGTFVAMNNRVSQSVAHLHVHVVPRNKKDGLRGFFWPRTTYDSAEEAESYRDVIAKAL